MEPYVFILLLVFIFSAFWFVGLCVYGYHVFLYGLPSDKTKQSLFILIFLAMCIFLSGVFYLSGFDWRGMW